MVPVPYFGDNDCFLIPKVKMGSEDKSGFKWCEPGCRYASFPDSGHLDGACHTFIALYCSKYGRLVQKSGPCLDLTEDSDDETGPG
jgi:hypothetical protein